MSTIVITGIGPVSAIGIGRDAWQRGLRDGRSGISPLSLFTAEHPTAEVRGLDLDAILPSQKTYLDRASGFTLAAGHLALTDAGITRGTLDRWCAGVVLGSEFGCLNTLQLFTTTLQQKGARLANPLLFSHLYVNTPPSLAAIEFGLGGHHGTYTGLGAGRQALEGAVEALRLGRAELVLAIGVDTISEPLYRALIAENALDDDVLGEGACALVLETAESAATRGVAGVPIDMVRDTDLTLRAQLGRTFAAEPFFTSARHLVLASA